MSIFKKVRTFVLKKEKVNNSWVLINAEGKTLGRLATRIADILRGKDKPDYSPHVDSGRYVIVTNAEKIKVSGNKLKDKKYYSHSGYAGGFKTRRFEEQLVKAPEKIIIHAVKGMLPKSSLASKVLKKLKVYKGNIHPHGANKPVEINII